MVGAYIVPRPKVKHVANIWGVYVNADYRGQGIGTRLLAAVLDELSRRPEIVKVKLQVNAEQIAAVALYEYAGFTTIGRAERELYVGERFYDELLMEKLGG